MMQSERPRDGAGTAKAGELPDDPRLMQAVQEFLAQLEAGHRPDRNEFARRYADLAGPLLQCLDGLELVHKAAARKKPRANDHDAAGDPLLANPLGDFRILREIGRGGMGVVYEAVQLSLGRRVALKVLPFAATFDTKHLQRFKNEAQAAGQLHHTNIVPVYFVGSERGVHFYAMQLIEGQSLAAVIAQVRKEAGLRDAAEPPASVGLSPQGTAIDPPSTEQTPAARPGHSSSETVSQISLALSTHRSGKRQEFFRSAAQFIVQAAEALEHAHQFGIVHRDIKPANLLVDVRGRLWITDFGLAQFHAEAGLTQTGDIMGTLRYMSPEQAAGKRVLIDHRADIYSLGATLYELATLQPIFPGQCRADLLRQIIGEDPVPPRSVEPTVPVDLETIILKAVSKNPAERYTTAGELSADLQRFLEYKPVLAKRPTLVDRGRKWMRRHPSFVGAAVLLLAFGVIALGLSTALIARERGKEKQRAKEAEARFQMARRAADDMIQLAEIELADNNPMQENLRRRLLAAALAYYEEFIELRGEDPDAQAELAVTRDRVKKILGDLAMLQGTGRVFLLRNDDVLADLRISAEQRERIAELNRGLDEQLRNRFLGFRKLTPDEVRQRFVEEARTNEAAMAAILRPDQLGRLWQIELQAQGPRAFHESKAAEALKLTAEQKRKIRQIREEAMTAMFNEPFEPRGPPGFGKHPSMARIQRNEVERIVGILTVEQMTCWREISGEPFKGDLGALPHCSPGPPGFPGGPPPGGPGGPPPPGRPPGSFGPR